MRPYGCWQLITNGADGVTVEAKAQEPVEKAATEEEVVRTPDIALAGRRTPIVTVLSFEGERQLVWIA